MTHDEARDVFTARIDDALDADTRARLERHLAGCADCRRELDRLERTVALLRQAPPVHAPAGFADRVVAAVRPAPRRRRLVHALFRPLPVKLPLHAAAVLLVAVTATWLLRATPELREAQRPAPAVSERAAAPRSEPPAAPPREAFRDSSERPGAAGARADREARLRAKEQRPVTPSPAAPERSVAAETETGAAGGVVLATWATADRAGATQALEALVARLGGTALSRREDPDATVVEVWLPEGAWAAVARELERRGALRLDRGGSAVEGPVRATVRITG